MILFDMDGTLVKWESASVEETYMPGFFRRKEIEDSVAKLIRLLQADGEEVGICSAVYSDGPAEGDKIWWLENNHLDDIPRVFVPYGADKSQYFTGKGHVLIDDFSKNLRAWEANGFTGIKFYNGINGTKGTWNGFSIDHKMDPEKMFIVVKGVAEYAAAQ